MSTKSAQQTLIVAPSHGVYVHVCRKLGISPVVAVHVNTMSRVRGYSGCRVVSVMSLAEWSHASVLQLQLAAGDGGNLGEIEYLTL